MESGSEYEECNLNTGLTYAWIRERFTVDRLNVETEKTSSP